MSPTIYTYRNVNIERVRSSFAGFRAYINLDYDYYNFQEQWPMADTFGGIIRWIDRLLGEEGAYHVPTCAECDCLIDNDLILCAECEAWLEEQGE